VSDFVDGLVKKVTGDKNATLGGKAYEGIQGIKDMVGLGPGKTIRETIGNFESGKAGYGAYKNKDAGIVSYGKYQFTAHNGKSSSLAQVLDQYASNGGVQAERQKNTLKLLKMVAGLVSETTRVSSPCLKVHQARKQCRPPKSRLLTRDIITRQWLLPKSPVSM
jgi:hypothetical protein